MQTSGRAKSWQKMIGSEEMELIPKAFWRPDPYQAPIAALADVSVAQTSHKRRLREIHLGSHGLHQTARSVAF